MKEMSMKTVSNVMAGVGIAIVMGSFILNAAGLTHIAMTFLPVDCGQQRTLFYRENGVIVATSLFPTNLR